ncbi:hypothetical protein GVM20_11325 [Porphyrobacter sp. SLTP]|uniref:GDYXXLXY domain-containing protein n=1 Tax=Porphyrobacter sp. SLTP TaxID=2683266 RepID=UPI0014134014|nr:GDYXXLXY domain-containing protein [Porphyrobacter sp. SLTP]NBB25719.1 hypothetical protein [Porphyrobacter sp. SLTP]
MNRLIRLATVVVPVLGLGALWAQSDRTYHQGTEWEVPIQGYDPRDYLRGHYVEFSYDWPGFDARELDQWPAALCLAGKPPRLDAVSAADDAAACPHPITTDGNGVYGISALMTGRLYIGQDRAAQLEEQLRSGDQRGIVTIRQREDGSFTPIAIRFRPLTPAEIAARDAQRAEELLPPPAIKSR